NAGFAGAPVHDAAAVLALGVQRTAADRGAGLILDQRLALGRAAPVGVNEAAPPFNDLPQLVERGDGVGVRLAHRRGALEQVLLDRVEGGAKLGGEARPRDGPLLGTA